MDKKNVQNQKVNIIIEIKNFQKIGPYHNGLKRKNKFSKPYHNFFLFFGQF